MNVTIYQATHFLITKSYKIAIKQGFIITTYIEYAYIVVYNNLGRFVYCPSTIPTRTEGKALNTLQYTYNNNNNNNNNVKYSTALSKKKYIYACMMYVQMQ